MSQKYFQCLTRFDRTQSLILNRRFAALDAALSSLSNNQFVFENRTTIPTAGTDSNRLYARANTFYQSDAAGIETPVGSRVLTYANIQHQLPSGTGGGVAVNQGTWETRTLNTVVSDVDDIVSLASNQILLSAGMYRIRAAAASYWVDRYTLRLRDITHGVSLAIGMGCKPTQADDIGNIASVVGGFTLVSSALIELQHYYMTNFNNIQALGQPASWGTEVYADVEVWKLS